MRNMILLAALFCLSLSAAQAQKWSDLTREEKLMKAKEFRAENQRFLKDSLGLSAEQMTDIDNVNICFLSTLDRIDRYGKDQATKEKYAKAVMDARWAQIDAIMGADKHKQYAVYLKNKIQAAMAKNKS
ncbi:MAG: hypothetical protein C5B59_12465 [Bacteroidetes bacterium]|nr:MAG: hypothetical protein C5B59_12465 [Bacteroidota bacterium]